MLPFARLAPSFTKNQLLLFLGENYMKADGQVSYLCNFLNMTCITYHPNTPTNSNSYRTPLEKFSGSAHVDDHFQTRRSETCICHILCLFSDVYTCSYFFSACCFSARCRAVSGTWTYPFLRCMHGHVIMSFPAPDTQTLSSCSIASRNYS